MRIGLAADHGGFALKQELAERLSESDYTIIDFGAERNLPDDDYPDYVAQLARAVADREIDRGVAVCGSGVGASIAANKTPGVRAALVHDAFSARQGVEDDDMNILCLGGRVVGSALAWELVQIFAAARFSGQERHRRRLAKIAEMEQKSPARVGCCEQ